MHRLSGRVRDIWNTRVEEPRRSRLSPFRIPAEARFSLAVAQIRGKWNKKKLFFIPLPPTQIQRIGTFSSIDYDSYTKHKKKRPRKEIIAGKG